MRNFNSEIVVKNKLSFIAKMRELQNPEPVKAFQLLKC